MHCNCVLILCYKDLEMEFLDYWSTSLKFTIFVYEHRLTLIGQINYSREPTTSKKRLKKKTKMKKKKIRKEAWPI